MLLADGDPVGWDMGADIVKVFPATSLGPGYIKDLRGPFPSIKLMPTGGVSRENAADWIRAGAVAIGAGSALVDAEGRGRRASSTTITGECARVCATRVRGSALMAKTVCFGEIMLRLSPPGFERLLQSPRCRPPSAAGKPTLR